MSFVRSYSKHEASFIFNLKDYDLAGLASTFCLLRLPAMPELRSSSKSDNWEDISVDWDSYAYKNKDKETARQETLAKEKERISQGLPLTDLKRKKGPPKATQAWSNKLDARERKDQRKEKKARKRAYLKAQLAGPAPETGKELSGQSGNEDSADDDLPEEHASKRTKSSHAIDVTFAS